MRVASEESESRVVDLRYAESRLRESAVFASLGATGQYDPVGIPPNFCPIVGGSAPWRTCGGDSCGAATMTGERKCYECNLAILSSKSAADASGRLRNKRVNLANEFPPDTPEIVYIACNPYHFWQRNFAAQKGNQVTFRS